MSTPPPSITNKKIKIFKKTSKFYDPTRKADFTAPQNFDNAIKTNISKCCGAARACEVKCIEEENVVKCNDSIKEPSPQQSQPEININSRCIAICSDNTQCTRVKKRGCLLCGNHAKNDTSRVSVIDVWVEEINGIVYYLDKNGNVYDTESVLENRPNPFIIGKYSGIKPNISIHFI